MLNHVLAASDALVLDVSGNIITSIIRSRANIKIIYLNCKPHRYNNLADIAIYDIILLI